MEQKKKILENLAPSLDDIFKRHLTFMHGVCPENFILNSFQGLLLGSFQQLSTIEKLSVLESGMNLILEEEVFDYNSNLMEVWAETKHAGSEIDSEKTRNTIYLINVIENYCNVFKIATMRGYHLALLCKKYKIYLYKNDVRELGESDLIANFNDLVNDIDEDEEFTFSKDFHHIHKQAWQDGFFMGFVTSEEGKNHEDYLAIKNACHPSNKPIERQSDKQKLLELLTEKKSDK